MAMKKNQKKAAPARKTQGRNLSDAQMKKLSGGAGYQAPAEQRGIRARRVRPSSDCCCGGDDD